MRTLHALLLLTLASLTACGGGGGGTTTTTTTTTGSTSSIFQLIRTSTATYTTSSKTSISSVVNGFANYPDGFISSGDMFRSFSMHNDANSISANYTGVSQPGVAYSASQAFNSDHIGMLGTTFQYARSGQFIDYTDIDSRHTKITAAGFYHYKDQPTSAPPAGTYANAGKALGIYSSGTSVDTFECDISVALAISGTDQTATITPSNCISNKGSGTTYPTTGHVVVIQTPVPTTISTSGLRRTSTSTVNMRVGAPNAQTPLSFSSASGEFGVFGQAGEEMVGAFEIRTSENMQSFALFNFAVKK